MRNRTVFWLTVGTFAGGASASCARTADAIIAVPPAPSRGSNEVALADQVVGATEVPSSPSSNELTDEDRQIAVLASARESFEQFIERAGTDAEYAEAVARSRQRLEDIEATIRFLEESKQSRLGAER
ncbi:MAG: hypothetical protein JW751_01580 [Polyangiaceae bacterium]|nr:hypothetical protein [Polyangiaceae bacterium]